MLFNRWGEIINWSIGSGNNHFGITINYLPFYEPTIEYKYIQTYIDSMYNNLENILIKYFPTLTFFQIVTEVGKSNKIHYHIIVAIRNFIDYNHIIRNNLIIILNKKLSEDIEWGGKFNYRYDIRVDSLFYFKDIKNWVIYIHKDMFNWSYTSNLYATKSLMYEDLILRNEEEEKLDKVNLFYKLLSEFDALNLDGHLEINYKLFFVKNINHRLSYILENLNGIKLTYNKIDQRTLINILQYYLILNEYFIYNDSIYEKIKSSQISYQLVGTIIDVLYNNFQQNVVVYFNTHFEHYFKNFDFNFVLDTYFIKTKNIIELIKDISTQRINPDFSLMEFTDGIYSVKYNRFFPRNNDFIINNKLTTIKFYNKSYEWIRRKKPSEWINGLKNALNIKNNQLENSDFINICLYLINTIHKDIFNKKSTLFIYGESNTGKTSLMVNPLRDYFGNNNVGSIVSAKNFKWQELENKIIGIIDEGRYNQSMSSDLLKITGQETITIEKKYSKKHVSVEPIPLFILSNKLFQDNDPLIDEALKNRMFIVEFINTVNKLNINNSNEFKKNVKDEEANIIIYCNKLFFNNPKKWIKNKSLKKLELSYNNEGV